MKKKKALITGISGQDGAYLAKFLLEKGYNVVGANRQNTGSSLWRLKELNIKEKVKIVKFDLLDEKNINKIIRYGHYDEIYNLAAQSFVDKSFSSPVYTSNVNAIGVTKILEAIRNFSNKTRFYQASSSEMYGNVKSRVQDEKTNFQPVSPYAVSKLYAHWMLNLYREAYKLFCCSGILFNHDSPLRGDQFVTQKIVKDLVKVKLGLLPFISLGNIYVKRDWGYSQDYIEAMWKMLQQEKAEDFVISSGNTRTVKTFINKVARKLNFKIEWQGTGLNEIAVNKANYQVIVKINRSLFRPTEVAHTYGNFNKARKVLKWKPKTCFDDLVTIMCEAELAKYK